MPEMIYRVVEHDGGWAYVAGGAYSEAYPTAEQARAAATSAAQRQRLEGDTSYIEYEDAGGEWHQELAAGGDRPETSVADEGEDRGPGSLSRDVRAEEPLPEGPGRRARP
jgi:hypothetical protein